MNIWHKVLSLTVRLFAKPIISYAKKVQTI